MATVLNVAPASGLLDIALAGNTGEFLYDVEHLSNYVPTFGDEAWCIQSGPDLIVWDRVGTRVFTDPIVETPLGNFPNPYGPYYLEQRGPALWERSGGSNTGAGGGASANIWPLNEPPLFSGASNLVSVLVGQRTVVAVGMSCFIGLVQNEATPVSEGAGYVGFGAVPQPGTVDPETAQEWTITPGPFYGLKYAGPVPSGALMSRWTVGELAGPGLWQFALSFSAHGCSVQFTHRELWVLTL
ncbi:MAG: hypothetical protein M3N43_01790 [Actinomycetota bacterium]|nr:hypothetical protein [Actinomycetota bacterium]